MDVHEIEIDFSNTARLRDKKISLHYTDKKITTDADLIITDAEHKQPINSRETFLWRANAEDSAGNKFELRVVHNHDSAAFGYLISKTGAQATGVWGGDE